MDSLEASSPEALDFSELQAQTKTSVDVFRCLIGRGDLNPHPGLIKWGLQPRCWHKAVISRPGRGNMSFSCLNLLRR